ncbi:MAG: 30S ribosomal protein S19 [Candidatus Hodarchaeota archaeon]
MVSTTKKVVYRGYTLEELQSLSMDDIINLLPSRQRRALLRGLSEPQRKLIERLRKAKKIALKEGEVPVVRTHCRDLIILPEFVGLKIAIHNGKEFIEIEIRPEMIGHYLGEYAPTNKIIKHSAPGVGATKSSMYVPLK